MATSGKVPTLGFLARIRNVVWLGFGAGGTDDGSTVADAYLDDFIVVPAEGRFIDVPAEGRFITVPAEGRFITVTLR